MMALIGEICGNIRLRTHDAVERKPLAQTHGRFLALLVFKQLTGQLLLQCRFLFLFRQQRNTFDVHKTRRHLKKFARNVHICRLHLVNLRHVLL